MFVMVDERPEVANAYVAAFRAEGVVALGLGPQEFDGWFAAAAEDDLDAVHCFLLGEFPGRKACPETIRQRAIAGIIALADVRSLESTLELFGAGIDDVVRKPVHVREIMARAAAIWRRSLGQQLASRTRLRVFFDGRDPEVDGEPLPLPRRERRILEFLVKNAHRRVTKTQIFNAVYGIFEHDVDEVVVEGHVSKLRRKLRLLLGHDVIDAKRYLGYQYVGMDTPASAPSSPAVTGLVVAAPAPPPVGTESDQLPATVALA
jgi:DNA-binding response OmpR family regulator